MNEVVRIGLWGGECAQLRHLKGIPFPNPAVLMVVFPVNLIAIIS